MWICIPLVQLHFKCKQYVIVDMENYLYIKYMYTGINSGFEKRIRTSKKKRGGGLHGDGVW